MTFIVIDIENEKTVLDLQDSLFCMPDFGKQEKFFSDLINCLLSNFENQGTASKSSVLFSLLIKLLAICLQNPINFANIAYRLCV